MEHIKFWNKTKHFIFKSKENMCKWNKSFKFFCVGRRFFYLFDKFYRNN